VILSGADFALLKLFLDHPQQILDRDTIGNATRGRDLMPLDRSSTWPSAVCANACAIPKNRRG
jgi:DNA-binding response OmpR family regulator